MAQTQLKIVNQSRFKVYYVKSLLITYSLSNKNVLSTSSAENARPNVYRGDAVFSETVFSNFLQPTQLVHGRLKLLYF